MRSTGGRIAAAIVKLPIHLHCSCLFIYLRNTSSHVSNPPMCRLLAFVVTVTLAATIPPLTIPSALLLRPLFLLLLLPLPPGMVDVIFADVAQPDQARIVALNAQYFLKNGGHFVISIKASCIDSTAAPEAVFAREVKKLQGAWSILPAFRLGLACHFLSQKTWENSCTSL